MSARTRGDSRSRGHVRERDGRGGSGGCGGCGSVGGSGCGFPRKSIAVAKGDPPALNLSWWQRSDLLNLAQTADMVFPAASDVTRDTSSTDVDPAVDYDSELQGTIQFLPPRNYYDRGSIR